MQAVKIIVEDVCDRVIDSVVPQYRSLAAGMKQIMQDSVEKRVNYVDVVVEQWLNVESDAFTLQVELFELYNKKKVARFQEAFDEMSPDLMQMFRMGEDEAQDQAREKMSEWYKKTHSVGDRTNEHHEAQDMQMLLESYWKTAVDRAIDSMCMKLDQHVVRGLDEEILGSFLQLSIDDSKCASYFTQDPCIREKRIQLESRLKRLTRAQALISQSI